MIPLGPIVAIGAIGALILKGIHDDDRKKKEREKRSQRELALWNGGKCAKCGNKWHTYTYYPVGCRGEYRYTDITCHTCKRKATLEVYEPSHMKYERVDLDKA